MWLKPLKHMGYNTICFCVSVISILATAYAKPFEPALLVHAARQQIGVVTYYDPSYQKLAYPMGDVASDRGVCTDVIIRALRTAYHLDLQQKIHKDMTQHFAVYPKKWGLKQPDRHIDHRRVPNIETYFKRQGWNVPISNNPKDYHAGDIVTSIIPPQLPHIMIVSSKRTVWGIPYVIHNIGQGTQEEDRLFEFNIVGHYRLP